MGDVSAPDTAWYGRLDRATIVDAGLRIAARPDTAQVRFRDLGDELGADPTAVYRHFRNKAALMAALIERLMSDVTASLPPGGAWRETLETMASSTLDIFVAHPAIGTHLMDARPVGPAELALVEASLRAFEAAGLEGDELVEHYGAFSGMLLAYVAAACRERVTAGSAVAGIEDVPWLPTEVEISGAAYPVLGRYAVQLFGMDFKSTYYAGVRVLIDAIARTAG